MGLLLHFAWVNSLSIRENLIGAGQKERERVKIRAAFVSGSQKRGSAPTREGGEREHSRGFARKQHMIDWGHA